MTIVISQKTAMKTKTMPAGLFKTHCLAVMDEVQAKSQAVIITKHGKPVAKLVPITDQRNDLFGFLKGKATIVGDIVSPAVPEEEWESLQ